MFTFIPALFCAYLIDMTAWHTQTVVNVSYDAALDATTLIDAGTDDAVVQTVHTARVTRVDARVVALTLNLGTAVDVATHNVDTVLTARVARSLFTTHSLNRITNNAQHAQTTHTTNHTKT